MRTSGKLIICLCICSAALATFGVFDEPTKPVIIAVATVWLMAGIAAISQMHVASLESQQYEVEFAAISKLEIGDSEMIVLKTSEALSAQTAARIKEHFEDAFRRAGMKVPATLVLDKFIDLQCVKTERT